jgi:hypothetical protein
MKIQAKKIADALKRAQRVGEVEEAVTIAGCSLVIRSLTNPEYVALTTALNGLEDIEYAVAFRIEHICRAICEINGESLREVDFVEVDVENPKTAKVESQLLERHQFVKDYVLASWSREALDVAMRKFNDVVEKAEKAASDGIRFDTPDESAEEAYRRLLAETKELEGAVPFELATKIRDEFGYLLKQEWAALNERLPGVPEATQADEPEAVTAPVPPPQPVVAPTSVQQSTNSILRRPAATKPVADTPQAMGVPLIPPMGPPVTISPTLAQKQAEIAALEGDVMMGGVGATPETAYNPAVTLPRNPVEAQKILDQPPTGGINPRFKAPPKL